jgi:hypothetical protein
MSGEFPELPFDISASTLEAGTPEDQLEPVNQPLDVPPFQVVCAAADRGEAINATNAAMESESDFMDVL